MRIHGCGLCLAATLLLAPAAHGQPAADRRVRADAERDTALRVVISIDRRRLWVLQGTGDTLLRAPVAVGSGRTLVGAQRWTFRTPRGVLTVLGKEVEPIWIRPEWSYVEVARQHGLGIERLDAARPRVLSDATALVLRDRRVCLLDRGEAAPLPLDEEIVFDNVLFIPPMESANRRVDGVLGHYRLNLGDGIGLHGTPDAASVGRAVTHGCLRLGDDALEWVYQNVPVGTRVYIY